MTFKIRYKDGRVLDIDDTELVTIHDTIKSDKTITRIDLSNHNLDTWGIVRELISTLYDPEVNITHINLGNCNITERQAQNLQDALEMNKKLVGINLTGNPEIQPSTLNIIHELLLANTQEPGEGAEAAGGVASGGAEVYATNGEREVAEAQAAGQTHDHPDYGL